MKRDIYNKFVTDFTESLSNIKDKKHFSNFVIFCVGTDRVTGDSVGPLVGHKLKKVFKENSKISVLGDFDDIITAKNLEEKLNLLEREHNASCVIVIDSALSEEKNIGSIIISNGQTELGSGLYKSIGSIGDVSVRAVVAKNRYNMESNFNNLKNTRLRASNELG